MITITMVNQPMVELVWPSVEPFIELAVGKSNGEITSEQVKGKLDKTEMAIATIHRNDVLVAAITFEQREFASGKRVLHVATVGGKYVEEWLDEADALAEQLARRYNCSELYIIGRPGWLKLGKKRGYEHIHTTISRKIGE